MVPTEDITRATTHQTHFENGKEIVKAQDLHFQQLSLEMHRNEPTKDDGEEQTDTCDEVVELFLVFVEKGHRPNDPSKREHRQQIQKYKEPTRNVTLTSAKSLEERVLGVNLVYFERLQHQKAFFFLFCFGGMSAIDRALVHVTN